MHQKPSADAGKAMLEYRYREKIVETLKNNGATIQRRMRAGRALIKAAKAAGFTVDEAE
jgi:hypothetical protein